MIVSLFKQQIECVVRGRACNVNNIKNLVQFVTCDSESWAMNLRMIHKLKRGTRMYDIIYGINKVNQRRGGYVSPWRKDGR